MQELRQLLKMLGVNSTYRGQWTTARAVKLVRDDEERLCYVVDKLYKVIGAEQGRSWRAVEGQIRTAAKTAWRTNSQSLANMAGYPLPKPPTPSEFIEILYNYTQHSE